MDKIFSVGIDFGTNSVRSVIISNRGELYGQGVYSYAVGEKGILLDENAPLVARQSPLEYVRGLKSSLHDALKDAALREDYSAEKIIGIGVDTTGSTPIPVDENGTPLSYKDKDNLAAYAWLWKDHTSHAEAAEITSLAKEKRPEYLAKIGGVYSSEWFWAKLLHCARTAPEVFKAAHTWLEHCDWIPALLSGIKDPSKIRRGVCAAGHKAMFHSDWGGYPDKDFLGELHPELSRIRDTLPNKAYNIGDCAGTLTPEWAEEFGIQSGIPVAVGAFDAHMGGVGSGIKAGTLVKIMGTSTCDIMVAPLADEIKDVPGICGIVPESVLPGHYGLEAGQSAVGDIFNWFVDGISPAGENHETLTEKASELAPGQSGLLALDWHNGNRNILVDTNLTGMIVGLTLRSKPEEIYRALVEATAFGARKILDRITEFGVEVERIICCGGISLKNKMLLQIYADITGRSLEISACPQTCARGAAMSGMVVAGSSNGGFDKFEDAIDEMTSTLPEKFVPIKKNKCVYERLYQLYTLAHDAHGLAGTTLDMSGLMKKLIEIRSEHSGL